MLSCPAEKKCNSFPSKNISFKNSTILKIQFKALRCQPYLGLHNPLPAIFSTFKTLSACLNTPKRNKPILGTSNVKRVEDVER